MTAMVSGQPDSSFVVTVSFDSIDINTEGSIPPRGVAQPTSLHSVIRGTFSLVASSTEVQLPDSLCAYGHFAMIARELLLPELRLQVQPSVRQTFTDSVTQNSCRAGITVGVTTVRELRNAGRSGGDLTMRQESHIQGAGMIRRDSIIVAGVSSSHGRVSFAALNRLPTLITSESEGTITVQLGSTVSRFQQRATQEIRLVSTEPN
jgi:hypothetical protein